MFIVCNLVCIMKEGIFLKVRLYGKSFARCLLGIALLVPAAWGCVEGYYILTHVATDDAYVAGDVAPISAQVSAVIQNVAVVDNQKVKKGELLLTLDSSDYIAVLGLKQAGYEEAKAEFQELTADEIRQKSLIAGAKANLEAAHEQRLMDDKTQSRDLGLLKQDALAQSRYDKAFTRQGVSRAQEQVAEQEVRTQETTLQQILAQKATQMIRIAQERYGVELARLDLDRTEIRAPWDGSVAQRAAVVGKYIQTGQAVLTLVRDDNLWITANFKETQIAGMKPGDPVDIDVDAFSGPMMKGWVDSLQPGSGSTFSLLPPENATGNFVKIVQRIPVKIVLDSSDSRVADLKIGMSVTVHVSKSR